MRWELIIDEIETTMQVGICPHEQGVPQRLLVSATLWATYPARPESIDQCINYALLHELVTKTWRTRSQTPLLETLAMELFTYVFNYSPAIEQASIAITKPDILPDIKQVGIKATLTRAEFEAL